MNAETDTISAKRCVFMTWYCTSHSCKNQCKKKCVKLSALFRETNYDHVSLTYPIDTCEKDMCSKNVKHQEVLSSHLGTVRDQRRYLHFLRFSVMTLRASTRCDVRLAHDASSVRSLFVAFLLDQYLSQSANLLLIARIPFLIIAPVGSTTAHRLPPLLPLNFFKSFAESSTDSDQS